jgi:hypothetical protein
MVYASFLVKRAPPFPGRDGLLNAFNKLTPNYDDDLIKPFSLRLSLGEEFRECFLQSHRLLR